MSKRGIEFKTLTQLVSSDTNWSLCIGAGSSYGFFPLWNELAMDIMREQNKLYDEQSAQKILDEFGPDTLIQAVINDNNISEEDAVKLLSRCLYKNLKAQLTSNEWNIVVKGLSYTSPSDGHNIWSDYLAIIRKLCNQNHNQTPIILGDMICKAITVNKEPMYILSFNAEPLLFSIINAQTVSRLRSNIKHLDIINETISYRQKNRIPYIYCHGTVPIYGSSKRSANRMSVVDKTVFSENEYLQLSNISYSWQSASFITAASYSSIFFVGLSMTDYNIRRWLSWLHAARVRDIKHKNPLATDSTHHYWINVSPHNAQQKKWYEACVAHLGVRIIWIDDWSQIKDVFSIALNI